MSDQKVSPMLIESYFDGAVKSEELEAVCGEEIVETETWKALDELRNVVRTESELALDDIDGFDMLEAIHSKMDENPISRSKPRPMFGGKARWLPVVAAAALFLLSIPGWVALFSEPDAPAQTMPAVVYVDSGQNNQNMREVVCPPAPQQWEDNATQNSPISKEEQLTVEEMDFAIRHLIKRIEDLEDANRQGLENGDIALRHHSPDAPVHQL